MNILCRSAAIALFSCSALADTGIEVFCTHEQCEKMAISKVPENTVVYVIDSYSKTADKLNNTYLKGVTTLQQAESLIPQIESSELYKIMLAQMKSAGVGLEKVVRDYNLQKLPAYVCHRKNIGSDDIERAVIYGGTFSKAEHTCSLWAARGRHE